MELPSTSAQLLHLVCAMQWMRHVIPEFTSVIRSLSDFLEKVYTFAGKRTKRAASRVQLLHKGWNSTEAKSFLKCKQV